MSAPVHRAPLSPLGEWANDAACNGATPEWFDAVEHGEAGRQHIIDQRRAASLCAQCPVRTECALDATRNRMVGVWGGYLFSEHGRGHNLIDKSTKWWVARIDRAERLARGRIAPVEDGAA